MDRGAWWATVHGVAKRQKWLSYSHTHTHTHTQSGWRVNFPRMLSTWRSPRDLDQKVLHEQDAGEISPNPTGYPPTIRNEDLFDLNSLINLGIFSYKYKYTNITHLSGLITSVSCTWAWCELGLGKGERLPLDHKTQSQLLRELWMAVLSGSP